MSSQLGCVDFSARPLHRVRGTPYCSRLGGLPSYFPSTPPHSQPHPRCCACSLPLFLVLQLYAPAEKERALYVFGCNNASCSVPPGEQRRSTWVVLRSQGGLAAAGEEGQEEEGEEKALTESVASTTTAPADEWGSGGDWGESLEPAKGGGTGAVGGLLWGESTTPTLDSTTTTVPSSTDDEAKIPEEARGDGEEKCLPAFEISTVYLEEEEEGDSESESEEEEGERSSGGGAFKNSTLKGKSSGGGGKDWEYAQRMWERYTLEEKTREEERGGGGSREGVSPEAEAAATAAAGGDWGEEEGVKNGGDVEVEENEDEGDEEEEEEEEEEEGKDSKGGGGGVKNPSRFKGGKKGGSKVKRGGGAGGEKYEKTPAKVRYMLRFQRRIASYPSQVLRYCWDAPDTALWPCVPPPISPPPCPACGSKRQLEVQVLPTILYGLKVEEHAVYGGGEVGGGEGGETTSAPKAGSRGGNLGGGGMDFLSLLIYSCAESCDQGREEWCLPIIE